MPQNNDKHNHNDVATSDDQLGQSVFIKQIAEAIKNSHPPKSIAINGYWGSGKTSALLQLRDELQPITSNRDIMPVWFEAWRYQNEALPIVALLQEIRSHFGRWNNLLKGSAKLSGIVLRGVLGAFDETLKTASGGLMNPALGKIPDIAERWEKDNYQSQLANQQLSELLEEAIDKALGKEGRKLVIFIDDLDRCMPETALKLLEGIKVYLNLNNCVVVFGMDQRQIENSLRIALKLKEGSNDGDHHAREYLEKICQDIYHLPILDQDKKTSYLLFLLNNLSRNSAHQSHLDELEKVLKKYDCLPANPRKIKALANRLTDMLVRLQSIPSTVPTGALTRFQQQGLTSGYGILMSVAIIYTFHRRLNEQLAKNPQYISSVITFAETPPISTSGSDPIFEPMSDIKPSFSGTNDLPTNPSDSNVFRLHRLLIDMQSITEAELKPFLNL